MLQSDFRTLSLQTPRLLLRPMRAEDRAAFLHFHEVNLTHFSEWEATALQSQSAGETFDEMWQRTERSYTDGTAFRLFGFAADGRLAGIFALSEIVRRAFQNAYGGWRVSCEFTRQGIGTEGVPGMLDLAFAPSPRGLGLHRVQANVQPSNLASLALARKAGFREEGLARRYLDINGSWRDHVMFAKTTEEHSLTYLPSQ